MAPLILSLVAAAAVAGATVSWLVVRGFRDGDALGDVSVRAWDLGDEVTVVTANPGAETALVALRLDLPRPRFRRHAGAGAGAARRAASWRVRRQLPAQIGRGDHRIAAVAAGETSWVSLPVARGGRRPVAMAIVGTGGRLRQYRIPPTPIAAAPRTAAFTPLARQSSSTMPPARWSSRRSPGRSRLAPAPGGRCPPVRSSSPGSSS